MRAVLRQRGVIAPRASRVLRSARIRRAKACNLLKASRRRMATVRYVRSEPLAREMTEAAPSAARRTGCGRLALLKRRRRSGVLDATKESFNVIPSDGVDHGMVVTASVG